MQLFNLHNIQLSALQEKPFKLEKNIQSLFETNLWGLNGFRLIGSDIVINYLTVLS